MDNRIVIGILVGLLIGFGSGYIVQQNTVNGLTLEVFSLGSELEESIGELDALNSSYSELVTEKERLNASFVSLQLDYDSIFVELIEFREGIRHSIMFEELETQLTEAWERLNLITHRYLLELGVTPYAADVYEDLLDFTAKDNMSVIETSSIRCSFRDLEQNYHEICVFNDYGEGFFMNRVVYFDFMLSKLDIRSPSVNKLCLITLTEEPGDVKDLKTDGKEALFVYVRRENMSYRLRLQEIHDGNNYNADTVELEMNKTYHSVLYKKGDYVLLGVYEDEERTNLITSTFSNLHGPWGFRYLTLANSLGYKDRDQGNSGYVEKIEVRHIS